MKKILAFILLFSLVLLTACTQQEVTCGEGTIIVDGQCVAPQNDDEEPDPVQCGENETLVDGTCVENQEEPEELVCNLPGDTFYEFDFAAAANNLVSNEPGDLHTANNFVVWGQAENGLLVNTASVVDNSLVVSGLNGDQFNNYYDSGLGYQFFAYENDVTYTVCAIVEGPSGQYMTSEIGIYFGYGTKDDVLLTGEPQMIIQNFKPTQSTNDDRGQYVLFAGNVDGEIKVHEIIIVEND